MYKIGKSGGLFGRLLGPLLKTGLPLIKNVLKSLVENVLIPVELTAAASATDVATNKKMSGSGKATLIISNEEMNDIMKIVKSLTEPGLLIKGVSEKECRWSKKTKKRIPWNVITHFRCYFIMESMSK